ncbi:hypothetical protein GF420_09755 [candidate division GN15 bacterium]|nr:hypothetical protein [candidate division GN15 bacterium]
MPFKFSRCIALHTPESRQAVDFYTGVLNLPVAEHAESSTELKAGANRLFVEYGKAPQVVHEFIVPDLEAARSELEAAGCTVERWEGKGGCNYVRDPFGLVFNLWEDPEEF